jgi:hypothetical protein
LCKIFDNNGYKEITYRSEWSKAKNTAGGCMNNASVANNPQLKMRVKGNENVEIFCLLLVDMPMGG